MIGQSKIGGVRGEHMEFIVVTCSSLVLTYDKRPIAVLVPRVGTLHEQAALYLSTFDGVLKRWEDRNGDRDNYDTIYTVKRLTTSVRDRMLAGEIIPVSNSRGNFLPKRAVADLIPFQPERAAEFAERLTSE